MYVCVCAYVSVDESSVVTIGKLHMVDLAGSERLKTTGVTSGKRMEEMKKINASLTAFGQSLCLLHALVIR